MGHPCGETNPEATVYRLADGRRMCSKCRRKYSPHPRRPRLKAVIRKQVLASFWQGDSATRAAKRCGVNVKSALRLYRLAREAIGREVPEKQERAAAHPSQPTAEPERKRIAVFGVQEDLRSVRVLMPGEAMRLGGVRNASISWIYAPTPQAASRLKLSVFFRIAASNEVRLWHGRAQISRADSFWRFARERLKTYRGGYRFGLGLYLKEMAFRFNARSNPDGFRMLQQALGIP